MKKQTGRAVGVGVAVVVIGLAEGCRCGDCAAAGSGTGGEVGGGEPPAQAPAGGGGRVQGTFQGQLVGGIMAIGGETTGWVLLPPGATMEQGMEVDISRVQERAQGLHGRNVLIRGRVTERAYVERGRVQVLVAEAIDPAN